MNTTEVIDYILPIDPKEVLALSRLNINQWGNQIIFYQNQQVDLSQCDIAIIGVEEKGGDNAIAIRRELYKLYCWNSRAKVVDLGNIRPAPSPNDTAAALEMVLIGLMQKGVVCIILGDTQELTFAQYKAYAELNKTIQLAVVDECIDMENEFEQTNYLYKILAHQPQILNNYYQIGYQQFLVNPNKVEVLRKKHFECHRLGNMVEDIRRIEPLLRDSDAISIDITALSSADAPGQNQKSLNGFSSFDLCRIGRYAGISNKVSSVGFYGYKKEADNGMAAQALAQSIWYIIEGFYERRLEEPGENTRDYIIHNITLNEQDDLMEFVYSKKTGRWWMKIPVVHKDQPSYEMIPCTEEEYEIASRREIPDRWMNAFIRYSAD